MRLKNMFMYAATATTVLFGCSENEPLNNEEKQAPPATLSIRIDADGTIISKAETDQTIANMYVLIFENGGDAYKVAALDLEAGDTGGEGTAENVEIEVKEGAHKVLVIANFKGEASELESKSLTQVQAMMTVLSEEADGNLTMSSGVMDFTFLPAVTNKIGYATINGAEGEAYATPALRDPVKLYRSVARVQLSQLTLGESVDEAVYGTPVSFFLDDVFVANVKGHSKLAASDNTSLSIEATAAPDDKLWWYGDWSEYDAKDVLKKIAVENTYEWNDGLFFNCANETITVVVDASNSSYPVAASTGTPIGNYFYVYENEISDGKDPGGVGYQTLLILKGEYTSYKDGQEVTVRDRYYAIPVNIEGTEENTSNGVIRDHKGVIRNTIYDLRVTITGPGSELPYQPDARLFYNAKVEVAPWERIDIGTPTNPAEIN